MKSVPRILRDHRLWPLGVLVVVSLLLLPRLGSYGFWEPQEMDVAAHALPKSSDDLKLEEERSRAREARMVANKEALTQLTGPDQQENRDKLVAQIESQERAEALERDKDARPPLADALVDTSISIFGLGEFGARLPFFLLALLTALATYFLGVRIRSPRAGLLAALILLACPLFVFQARQLTSELGTMAGATLMIVAALGLCTPASASKARWLYAFDGVLLVAGGALASLDSGPFVGLLAPLVAMALALLATLVSGKVESAGDAPEETQAARRYLWIALGVSATLALLAFALFCYQVFSWVEADKGEFSIASHTLHASDRYQAWLGGSWRREGDLNINFESVFEQIAFGTFPWICIAPIALTRMATGGQTGTKALGARMIFAWAALAWAVSAVYSRKVGVTQFAAVPALAAGIGVWIDELLSARAQAQEGKETSRLQLSPPLVAFFVLFAGIVIAKDIKSFPVRLLNIHLDIGVASFPKGVSLHKVVVILGLLFTLSLFASLNFWQSEAQDSPSPSNNVLAFLSRRWHWLRARAGRHGLQAALALSLLSSVFLAQVWTPRLATKLSSKATFSVYHQLREEGNSLGIVGKPTAGSKYYADGPFEELSGRPALIKFLAHPERVFALVKASELCAIHTESSRLGFDYYVVDDSNADKVMLSNRMWNKEVAPPRELHALMRSFLDRNPLARAIVRTAPKDIQHPVSANFNDEIELIGIDLPESVDRGDSFEVTLYYRVIKKMTRNWQVFVHFDGGGVRFQGDHYPVNNRCGTNNWQPGDYIVDTFSVDAGGLTNPKTNYTVWTGFFVGSAGNWENMKALSGEPDSNNRVRVGTIRLK